MTSEAPERIWRWLLPNAGWVEYSDVKVTAETSQEYIRHDLHLALVAEAYEDAAVIADQMEDDAFACNDEFPLGEEYYPSCVAARIRTLTPADAIAALEELKGEADER